MINYTYCHHFDVYRYSLSHYCSDLPPFYLCLCYWLFVAYSAAFASCSTLAFAFSVAVSVAVTSFSDFPSASSISPALDAAFWSVILVFVTTFLVASPAVVTKLTATCSIGVSFLFLLCRLRFCYSCCRNHLSRPH